MNKYNEDYYENGVQLGISGYANYRWMPDLTIPMAKTIAKYLALDKGKHGILDFGCAKGFLVKAFTDLGYKCEGTDISKYALEKAPEDVRGKLFEYSEDNLFGRFYDTVVAKDVFEHIDPTVLSSILYELQKVSDRLFVVVPLGDGEKYVVPEYESDITHVIREDKDWWIDFFQLNGYKVQYFSYLMDGLKDNWSHYPEGNGFFILS
jgi:SAM-dependent methyltransferase